MSIAVPHREVGAEAVRILRAAADAAITLRAMGGVAVLIHTGADLHPALRRQPNDIDLVTLQGKSKVLTRLMEGLGYASNAEFNYTNGHRRLLYYDEENARQVDIFVGSFEMCHVIPISQRLEIDALSIPLAELLLTKLQVVQLNEKDQRDIIAILAQHPIGEIDEETVNASRIALLLGRDWGLWRTARMNLERTREALPAYELPEADRKVIAQRLIELWERVERQPKSTRWHLRNRIGDRLRWYEEPEEAN